MHTILTKVVPDNLKAMSEVCTTNVMQSGFQVCEAMTSTTHFICIFISSVNEMTRYQVPIEETSINFTNISEQVYWLIKIFQPQGPVSLKSYDVIASCD